MGSPCNVTTNDRDERQNNRPIDSSQRTPPPHASDFFQPLFLIQSKSLLTALCGIHAFSIQAQHAACANGFEDFNIKSIQQKIAGLQTG